MLRISDPSSPYNGMEIWRVKSQIVNPMFHEFKARGRAEAAEALAQNRKRKEILFPKPPVWYAESDVIEYPGYAPEVLRKVKLDE